MKKWHLVLSFLFCSVAMATEDVPLERLVDIDIEMTYLQAKRDLLIKKISADHHVEVNSQVGSMKEMVDYQWGDFVSKVKDAESHDEKAESEKKELLLVERQIAALANEAAGLSPTTFRRF